MTTSLNFTACLTILQLDARTFVDELTQSFQGTSDTVLPGAVLGVDTAVAFGFGSPNTITIGFLFGALGRFPMIGLPILLKPPTIVVAGPIPLFFNSAIITVYANNHNGVKAAYLFPFLSGLIQIGGSALSATQIGLSQYGGHLGMSDWATAWPLFMIIMKALDYVGVTVVVIGLLMIPQLQRRKNPEGYFMIVSDYGQHTKKLQED